MSEMLKRMTKEELFQWMDTAERDLKKAADEQNNSDWHSECFFALHALCVEANSRGIKRHQTH